MQAAPMRMWLGKGSVYTAEYQRGLSGGGLGPRFNSRGVEVPGPRFDPRGGGAQGPRFNPRGVGGPGPWFPPREGGGGPGPRFDFRGPVPGGGPGKLSDVQAPWPPFNPREGGGPVPLFKPPQSDWEGPRPPFNPLVGGLTRPPFNSLGLNGVQESGMYGPHGACRSNIVDRPYSSSVGDPPYGSSMIDPPYGSSMQGPPYESSMRDLPYSSSSSDAAPYSRQLGPAPLYNDQPFTSQGSSVLHHVHDARRSPSLSNEPWAQQAEDSGYREHYRSQSPYPALARSWSPQNGLVHNQRKRSPYLSLSRERSPYSVHRGSRKRSPYPFSDQSPHREHKRSRMQEPHPSVARRRSPHGSSKDSRRVPTDRSRESTRGSSKKDVRLSVPKSRSSYGVKDTRRRSPHREEKDVKRRASHTSLSRNHSPRDGSKHSVKSAPFRSASSGRSPQGGSKERKRSSYPVSRGQSPYRETKHSRRRISNSSVPSHQSLHKGVKDNRTRSSHSSVSRGRSPGDEAKKDMKKASTSSASRRHSPHRGVRDGKKGSPYSSKSGDCSASGGVKDNCKLPVQMSKNPKGDVQSAAIPAPQACRSLCEVRIRNFHISVKNKIIRKYLNCGFKKNRMMAYLAANSNLFPSQEPEVTAQDNPTAVSQSEDINKSQSAHLSLSGNQSPSKSNLSNSSTVVDHSYQNNAISSHSSISASSQVKPSILPVPQPFLRRYGVKATNFDLFYVCRHIRQSLMSHFERFGGVSSLEIHDQGTAKDRYALVFYEYRHEQDKALASTLKSGVLAGMVVTDWSGHSAEAELDSNATMILHVSNLENTTTGSDLWNAFKSFGEILHIEVKTESDCSNYALLQFIDITCVCAAIMKMDGQLLGKNKLKLGFGKSQPTDCVWISGLRFTKVIEQRLKDHCQRYGPVVKVLYDSKSTALVLYGNLSNAEAAVKALKADWFYGYRIKVDFANRRCQLEFCRSMESSGQGVRDFYQMLVETSVQEPQKK